MVLSMQAVKRIVNSGQCTCARPDSPDDMHLGSCLKRLGIAVTHLPYFHQVLLSVGDVCVGVGVYVRVCECNIDVVCVGAVCVCVSRRRGCVFVCCVCVSVI